MGEVEFYGRFDEVYVFALSIRGHQRGSARALPLPDAHVVPIYFRSNVFYMVNALLSVSNRAMWADIAELRVLHKLSLRRLLQIVGHYSRADYEARVVRRFLRDNVTDAAGDRTVLYAYRFLYQPYLMSRISTSFRNVKSIGRAHGIDLYEERSDTRYLPGRSVNLRALDELHTVSRHGAEYLGGRYPEHRQKVRTTYLGTVDHGVRRPRRGDGLLRLVSCSNVVGVKRMELLVESLGRVDTDVRVQWVHYGDGEDFDAILNLARRLPDNISVEFPGRVENESVLMAYLAGQHDVFINVSRSEGLPVSVMEACSTGLPVIATDVGGTREIVEHDVNGVLLPADVDSSLVARTIERFATIPDEEYDSMSRNARRIWSNAFDSERNYADFIEAMLKSEQ